MLLTIHPGWSAKAHVPPSSLTSHVAVGGLRARYRLDGAGAPVVLLHGIARSLEDWTEQHELLSEQFRVYSVDLAGYGMSEPLREQHSLPALARFVEAFLDAVGVTQPVHLVGNSLGGAGAMQVAVHAPDRVASLLLVNSAGFGREVTIALRVLAIRRLGRLLLRPSRSGARRVVPSLFHDPAFVTDERIAHAFELVAQPHAARVLLATARGLGTFRGVRAEWRQALLRAVARLSKPTLAVWGDRNLILPVTHLDAVPRLLPHARTHLFYDTGHMPQIERAEEFRQLAVAFWQSASRSGEGGPYRDVLRTQ